MADDGVDDETFGKSLEPVGSSAAAFSSHVPSFATYINIGNGVKPEKSPYDGR